MKNITISKNELKKIDDEIVKELESKKMEIEFHPEEEFAQMPFGFNLEKERGNVIKSIWLKVLQNEKDLQDLKDRFNLLVGDGK